MCDGSVIAILIEWQKNFNELQKLYYSASQRYNKRSNILQLLIVFSTIFSTSSALSGINNEKIRDVMLVVIAVIGSINLFLTAVESKFKWAGIADKFKLASINYKNLNLKIAKNISLKNINVELLINDIIKTYQGIEESTPILPVDLSPKQNEQYGHLVDCALTFRKTLNDIENSRSGVESI